MLYGEENKAKLRSMAFGYGSKEKGSVIPKYRLNEEIYAAFKENHVEMTYPHLRVHMEGHEAK